ncbi:dephospho-CoA kinase [Devosia sp. 1635]|uniref:dephospho-CoA kinase n=1 Tax=Devosia sp. 1635 TaxID=2726066 RepID=UPI001564447F|nr:dephospho-CoA kinase [Devosia sp. 1635]
MYRLGLTGSIATGKSAVLAAFAANGVPVFSADAAVAELYAGAAAPAVEALFPGVVVEGAVDRTRLSLQLAKNPGKFDRLEALVHPMVRARIAQFLADAAAAGETLAVVEVPLLYETGHDYGFDGVAVTVVDPAIQRERALARAGMTVDKLQTILARQLPQAEKQKRADFVFDTGKPLAVTQAEVAALVKALRAQQEQA